MSRRVRHPLVYVAAGLCLVAASCSGDDNATTTTDASATSSTLSASASAPTGVGEEFPGPTSPTVNDGKPRPKSGTSAGSKPPGGHTTASTSRQDKTTATTTITADATTTTATTVPPGLPPEKCPDAKTCRRHDFGGGNTAANAPRWPKGPDGQITVRYHINPTGSGLPEDHVRGAAERAFAAIMSAVPTVRVEFGGFTGRVPTPGDGFNDIGFVNANSGHALPQARNGVMLEADMLLGAGPGFWTWEPCEQRDNSCTAVCVKTPSGGGCRNELQSLMTHEGLHFFWLGDMSDDETDRELSMSPRAPHHDRWRSTLALGDVLGLRALYPCSCPLPPIYSP